MVDFYEWATGGLIAFALLIATCGLIATWVELFHGLLQLRKYEGRAKRQRLVRDSLYE